ncbi:MAG: HPr(Ser) kinase/phosphatase [Verrucomicrobiales bacterium]|nr:HPr(Ser) kinase/phosphatase [Verrucomicrobiales bacterium]|tara:strand:+ start:3646 stop:4587 length:942 start_codon:yes stop_codon:yes gene_type:complete
MKREKVTIEQFYVNGASDMGLRLVVGADGLKRIVREPTINRPGLALTGFTKYFANNRIQAIGAAEATYLKTLTEKQREERYAELCAQSIPGFVFSRNLRPDPQFIKAAEKADIPVFRCPLITMKFINRATLTLEDMFAPSGTEQGSTVDILGIGVLIKGESGIGKSECVLALVERGYSLVADDVTKVKLLDGREIIATSADLTRNHMEVRGIGIINVASMFGVKSIRNDKRINLVVSLRDWGEVEDIDRLGMEQETVKILDVPVPHITIPVRPGRDIARLVEVAAFQTKLLISGHNAARELDERLMAKMQAGE